KDVGFTHLKLPPNPGSPTIISPDGRFGVTVARFKSAAVARAAKAREAFLFDTASGKELGQIELEVEVTPLHRGPIRFSPDSKLLAVGLASTPNGRNGSPFTRSPAGNCCTRTGPTRLPRQAKPKAKAARKGPEERRRQEPLSEERRRQEPSSQEGRGGRR